MLNHYVDAVGTPVLSRQALDGLNPATPASLEQAERVVFVFRRDPKRSKDAFCPSHVAQLFVERESPDWLNTRQMDKACVPEDIPERLFTLVSQGRVRAVNGCAPNARTLFLPEPHRKKHLNLLALGDVGSTLAIGLRLLGGDVLASIGICDIRPEVCRRWELELNQIAGPEEEFPSVEIVKPENLFQCDAFVFCASLGVPAVTSGVADVRMAQLETNGKLLRTYAKQAVASGFSGLFAVVSDPVDHLCSVALSASREDGAKGLRPERILGFGLGVMSARAAYYAQKQKRFSRYLEEGRAYGPHGAQLVIADSVARYNNEISMELTRLAVEANLRIRELGYKPYVAPALSSGALSLLAALRGKWHYSAAFLGGVYFGARNRLTGNGLLLEHLPLPEALFSRIENAYGSLSL